MNMIVLWPVIQQVLGAAAMSAAIMSMAVCASKPQSIQFDSWRLRPSLDRFLVVHSQEDPSTAADHHVKQWEIGCSFDPDYVSYRVDSCTRATEGVTGILILAEPWIGWSDFKSPRLFNLSRPPQQALARNQNTLEN
jgi:hypothetical protein